MKTRELTSTELHEVNMAWLAYLDAADVATTIMDVTNAWERYGRILADRRIIPTLAGYRVLAEARQFCELVAS